MASLKFSFFKSSISYLFNYGKTECPKVQNPGADKNIMRFSGALVFLIALAGCSDVTPQVSLLRKPGQTPLVATANLPAETDLTSAARIKNDGGYELSVAVSKENKNATSTSTKGYQLLMNTQ